MASEGGEAVDAEAAASAAPEGQPGAAEGPAVGDRGPLPDENAVGTGDAPERVHVAAGGAGGSVDPREAADDAGDAAAGGSGGGGHTPGPSSSASEPVANRGYPRAHSATSSVLSHTVSDLEPMSYTAPLPGGSREAAQQAGAAGEAAAGPAMGLSSSVSNIEVAQRALDGGAEALQEPKARVVGRSFADIVLAVSGANAASPSPVPALRAAQQFGRRRTITREKEFQRALKRAQGYRAFFYDQLSGSGKLMPQLTTKGSSGSAPSPQASTHAGGSLRSNLSAPAGALDAAAVHLDETTTPTAGSDDAKPVPAPLHSSSGEGVFVRPAAFGAPSFGTTTSMASSAVTGGTEQRPSRLARKKDELKGLQRRQSHLFSVAEQTDKFSPARRAAWRLTQDPFFIFFVVVPAIVLNAVVVAVQLSNRDNSQEGVGSTFWILESIFCAFFVVELSVKGFAYRKAFLDDPWAVFDAIVVALAAIDVWILTPMGDSSTQGTAVATLRLFRIIRVGRLLRLIGVFRDLHVIVEGLVSSLRGLAWVAVLLLFTMFIYSVLFTVLIGHDPDFSGSVEVQALFGDISSSMFTSFQILTLEGWPDIARLVMERSPSSGLLFASFIILTAWVGLNLVTAVVVDHTMAAAEMNRAEVADSTSPQRRKTRKRLLNLFAQLAGGRRTLTLEQLHVGLGMEHVERLLNDLGVKPSQLEAAFSELAFSDDGTVDWVSFIDGLGDFDRPVKHLDMLTLTSSINSSMRELQLRMELQMRREMELQMTRMVPLVAAEVVRQMRDEAAAS